MIGNKFENMGSVDPSLSDLVTIVVKAPNQQIADQTIQCNLDWTIKRLKDYLSEVYPSKPKMEEQKLIYSGKLLTDSAVLKDILRTYEGQENHTVHLVCTSKAQKMSMMFPKASSSNTPRNTNNSSATPSSALYGNVPQAQVIPNIAVNSANVPINRPQAPSIDQMNATNFTSNEFNQRYFWPTSTAFINVNDVHANQQFAYMQQVYAQYVSQYMQMMGQPSFGYLASHVPQPVSRASQFSAVPNVNVVPQDRNHAEGNQIRDNQPAVAAVGNDIDEEDGRFNRDWLDWFYDCCRSIILLTVVYFYSTPWRLMIVFALGALFYMYHRLRLQNDHLNMNNNNNNNNAINHNDQNNDDRPAVDNVEGDNLRHRRPQRETADPPAPGVDIAAATASASADQTSTPTVENAALIPERPSPIAVTLLAIRTFFFSLIPDQPAM